MIFKGGKLVVVVVVVVTTVVWVVGAKENWPRISLELKSCLPCPSASGSFEDVWRLEPDAAGGERMPGVKAAMAFVQVNRSLACLRGMKGGGVFTFRGGSMKGSCQRPV